MDDKYWNGGAGDAWVEAQDLLDGMLAPFAAPLIEAAAARSGGRILDVGCGTGATTVEAARHGDATGVDISAQMLAAARARADRAGVPARFILADAQEYVFDRFDLVISRFGVMFFDDPVAAFANLRRATAGALRFVAWRSPEENEFATIPGRLAAPLLPDLPAPRPDGPGRFAFADPERVRGILADAGWGTVDIRPLDIECSLPEPQLMPYVTGLGPVGLALRGADAATRARVVEAVRPGLERFVHGDEVRFPAACWLVDATPQ